MARKDRDIEKTYSVKQTVAKLRRLADCIEQGKPFRIQIAGEKVNVPSDAVFTLTLHKFFIFYFIFMLLFATHRENEQDLFALPDLHS